MSVLKTSNKSDKISSLLLVLAFALTLRAIHLFFISFSPFFTSPQLDAFWHDQWAKEIARGDILGKEPFFRAPLYPYFLGLIYFIFGTSPFIPRIFQHLLGLISIFLVYRIAFIGFDRKIALLSSFLMAIWAPFIFYEGELLLETLSITLNLSAVYFLLKAFIGRDMKLWIFSGILFGLSAITRPNVLLPFGFILIYLLKKKIPLKTLVLMITACILIILPVTLRNLLIGKDLVFICSQGGINFYLGNSEFADGKTAFALGPEHSTGKYVDNVWLTSRQRAFNETGKSLKDSEVSRFWFKKGLEFIFFHPLKAIWLYIKKIYYFLNGYEIESNLDIYLLRPWSPVLKILLGKKWLFIPLGVFFPFSIIGFFLRPSKPIHFLTAIFPVAYSLSVVLFFVNSRFRLPVIPFVLIYASYGIMKLNDFIREGKKSYLLKWLILLMLLLLVCNSKLFGVDKKVSPIRDGLFLARAYYDNREFDKAKIILDSLYQNHPQNQEVIYNFASLSKDMGNKNEAIKFYLMLAEKSDYHFEALVNLGDIYYEDGNYSLAMQNFTKALKIKPNAGEPYYNIGNILKLNGKYQEAEEYYLKAIKFSPYLMEAYLQLAKLFKDQEKWNQSIKFYEQALKLDPQNCEVLLELAEVLIAINHTDEAKKIYQKLINSPKVNSEAVLSYGKFLLFTGEFQSAFKIFNEHIKKNPEDPAGYFYMGLFEAEGQNFLTAIQFFQKATNLNPDFGEAWFNLGILFDRIGEPLKAIDSYEKALASGYDSPHLFLNLGYLYGSLQAKYDLAIEMFKKAIAINPNFAEAYFNMGIAYKLWGKTEEAEIAFKRALQLKPQLKNNLK